MNKFKYLLLLFFTSVALAACLKDKAFMDVSGTQPIIEFSYGTSGASDVGNLGADPSIAKLDTAFALNIASPQVLDYPVTVTLKVDPTQIAKYNAAGNSPVTLLPDSIYQWKTTTVTIPAGYRISRVPITLFPSKLDPSKSYGLPISIVSATGPSGQNLIVSGNAGVAFFAFIGNPLSGAYTWDFTRYNGDTTTAPNGSSFAGQTTTAKTVTPTSLLFPDSYLSTFVGSTAGITVSWTNNGGVFSDFQASFDANTLKGLSDNGFTISQAPIILSYNIVGSAATNYSGSTFRTYFVLINSSGGVRTLVDKYVKK
jgi:hypothetical protein